MLKMACSGNRNVLYLTGLKHRQTCNIHDLNISFNSLVKVFGFYIGEYLQRIDVQVLFVVVVVEGSRGWTYRTRKSDDDSPVNGIEGFRAAEIQVNKNSSFLTQLLII